MSKDRTLEGWWGAGKREIQIVTAPPRLPSRRVEGMGAQNITKSARLDQFPPPKAQTIE